MESTQQEQIQTEQNQIQSQTQVEQIEPKKRKKRYSELLTEPEMLTYIGKCYSNGMSYIGIAKAIKNKFDIDVSNNGIKNAIQVFTTRRSDVIKGSYEMNQLIKGTIIDTEKDLRKLKDRCWGLLERAESEGIFESVAIMKEILKQMEFQEKILSRMHTNINQTKINKLEMTQVIVNSLDELEKQGVIKILRPNEVHNIGLESIEALEDENIEDYTIDAEIIGEKEEKEVKENGETN